MIRIVLVLTAFSVALCASNDNIQANDREPRIIGGLIAQTRQFPYVASIRRVNTLGHVGGGALISEAWVITAQTVTSLFTAANQCAVGLGILDVSVAIIAPAFVSTAQLFSNHPTENLALIRIPAVVCNAARFGVISPIFLESRVQDPITNALVVGWGPTTINKEPNTLLRFGRVDTIAINCPGPSTTLCTTGALCTTDVGSPLVTTAGLIGIASTTTCGQLDTYIRISAFRNWISAVTGV